jgi:non-ribosomal peptide synthetase component F
LRDVLALYDGHRRGEPARLGAAPRYRDYVAWLERREPGAAEAYWRQALAGFTAPTPPPLRLAPPAREGVASVGLHLAPERTAALQEQCRRWEVTASTLVHGAWGLLLSRYAGDGDVLFGATVAGRPAELAGVEEMVGLFINTLPVRVRVSGSETPGEWLRSLQNEQLRAREHEHVALVQLQKWSEVPAGEPLFDTLVAFENYPFDHALGEAVEGLRARPGPALEQTNYPLVLSAVPGERLELRLQYHRGSAQAEEAERLLGHLGTVLERMVAGPGGRLRDVSLLRDGERQQVLAAGNATAPAYPRACLHELFAAQAARTPHAPAVTYEGETLPYAELERMASGVARHLRRLGVGPETRVAVCAERSTGLVAAILGTLEAGAAYVPVDPAYPPDRVAYLLEDSGCAAVLVQRELRSLLPAGAGMRVLVLEDVLAARTTPRTSSTPRAPPAAPRAWW